MELNNKHLEAAICAAVLAHKEIYDKTGRPSILHPLRVMALIDSGDERRLKEMIVAVLHDTVEDTAVKLNMVEYHFGKEIADAVDAVSRRKGEIYMDYIKRCCENPIACVVKGADLADNLMREDGLPEKEKMSMRKRYMKALLVINKAIAKTGEMPSLIPSSG